MEEDVVRLPLFQDFPFVDEEDAVGDFPGKAHFVGDDGHGHAVFGQILDDVQYFADHFRVQCRCRFIEEHELRLHGQGAGNGHTLLLTAGQSFGIGVFLIGQADFFQELDSRLRRFILAFTAGLHGRQDDVLQDRHVREEIEALENHADFLADIVDALGIAHADAIDDDFPSRRLFQIVDAAQDRTLAGTGRADDDDDFFILNGQVDALQDFVLAKTFFQTFNFYHPLRTSVPNSLRDGQWSKS